MTLNRITNVLIVTVLALLVVGLSIWVLGMLGGDASAKGMEPIVLSAEGGQGSPLERFDASDFAGRYGLQGSHSTALGDDGEQELVSPIHLRSMNEAEHEGGAPYAPTHTRTTQGSMSSPSPNTSPTTAPTSAPMAPHAPATHAPATTAPHAPATAPHASEPERHSAPAPTNGGTATRSGSTEERDGRSSMPVQQTQPVESDPHYDGGMDGGGRHGG